MKTTKTLATLLLLMISCSVMAQNLTQTIKGRVIDELTKVSLPGANVVIMGSDPIMGSASDLDGYFKIEGVAVGRISVQINFIGYKTVTLRNLDLSSSKELVIDIEMQESLTEMEGVVVKARKTGEVNNDMATVSVRTFSIEESQRFAGGRNDVSKMASNFAGVRGANDAVNDIVIRGNSPNGLLWRLEGVDIPNPNHFGDGGATGGPVSILNNNVLSNSDFFTAAFPAEYMNALSGVFDLKMRNGNYEKHEFLGQIGFNGFELGAEGPISRESRSSYMVNARYSTLEVMSKMGMDFGTGTAIPEYQDASFKFFFPTKNAGTFSLFGLGGTSNIAFLQSEKDTTIEEKEDLYGVGNQDMTYQNKVGVIGLNHTYILNNTTYIKSTLSASTSNNRNVVDSLTPTLSKIRSYGQDFTRNQFQFNLSLNKKVNKQHSYTVGIQNKLLTFNMLDSSLIQAPDQYRILTDYNGETALIQPFAQWQYRIKDNLTMNGGISCQYLTFNKTNSIEPRLGMRWELEKGQQINAGYGLHSRMVDISIYNEQVDAIGEGYIKPNENLDFVKSHHFVLGYEKYFTEFLKFKTEVYYQYIYDAVVGASPSSFSMLNYNSYSYGRPDSLTNGGKGQNYGVELTMERSLDKGFYFMSTLSLYKSMYKGSDGIERGTAFDNNYVWNVLGGKEWNLGKTKENGKFKKVLVLDGNLTMAGGQLVTPVDLDQSKATGVMVYDDSRAYEEKLKDYLRIDVRIAFRMGGKRTTQEWAFDVQNVSNRQNPLFQNYSPEDQEVKTIYQLGIFPVMQYKITF